MTSQLKYMKNRTAQSVDGCKNMEALVKAQKDGFYQTT